MNITMFYVTAALPPDIISVLEQCAASGGKFDNFLIGDVFRAYLGRNV